ncbi:DNA/RNA helicase domain-containing protein [Micromonospora sp. KLBMP9576]|uniref:DNA/RNA helicase domain-containing protein n=1 Tax=Micromonospora sp. KLBMP9576 TaxID=3424769 RepID=UPI003D92F06A
MKAKNADRLVRNAYKVLLTRGLHGTLLYSVDPETQASLSRLIPAPRRRGSVVAPGVQRVGDERVSREPAGPTASGTSMVDRPSTAEPVIRERLSDSRPNH